MSQATKKQLATMEVQFRRTGERRYAVTVYRNNQPPMEMNPAPGYDPLMPHDLLHFIVESELGLRHGIFGQIADGGNAGTFHPLASTDESNREAARHRRRTSKRGEKLLHNGVRESAQSERATNLCLQAWLARSANPAHKKLAAETALQVKQIRVHLSPDENQALNETVVERICARMDELSGRWAALDVGQFLTVNWPGNR